MAMEHLPPFLKDLLKLDGVRVFTGLILYFPFEFAPELWSKFLFLCLIRRLRTYETPLELVRNDPFHRTTSSCQGQATGMGPRVILKNIMLTLFQVIEKSIYT